jgi:hypothetical protein
MELSYYPRASMASLVLQPQYSLGYYRTALLSMERRSIWWAHTRFSLGFGAGTRPGNPTTRVDSRRRAWIQKDKEITSFANGIVRGLTLRREN